MLSHLSISSSKQPSNACKEKLQARRMRLRISGLDGPIIKLANILELNETNKATNLYKKNEIFWERVCFFKKIA